MLRHGPAQARDGELIELPLSEAFKAAFDVKTDLRSPTDPFQDPRKRGSRLIKGVTDTSNQKQIARTCHPTPFLLQVARQLHQYTRYDAAIDNKLMTIDVRRLLGRQKCHRIRDIVDGAKPSYWHRAATQRPNLRICVKGLRYPPVDKAWGN